MGRLQALFLLWMLAIAAPAAAAASTPPPSGALQQVLQLPRGDFVTLNFHAVRGARVSTQQTDPYAISTTRLTQWFDWMNQHGWHPVSFERIVQAHNGGAPLPPNAVLLTFDDGLESIYTDVYPLLRAYDYPALFALETDWIERVHGGAAVNYQGEALSPAQRDESQRAERSPNLRVPGEVYYNGAELGAADFVSWAQVREMHGSGLAEFATHTHQLHHGILANPQGNLEPAAITRLYDETTASYETDAAFHARISEDLKRSIALIQKNTGIRTHIVVWPYGARSREVEQIAASVGLTYSFGLEDQHVSSPAHIQSLGRFLIAGDVDPADIESQVALAVEPEQQVQRTVQVDLDYVYDANPVQTNINLGKLLDRIKQLKVSTVYLQAFADPDGDGTATALYFPNHYLPMRADLFNRVMWQLKTRAGVKVYAWLPMLAFQLPDNAMNKALAVKVMQNGNAVPSPHAYRRLSPFLPRSVKIVSGIYGDLAKNSAGINGILISDDSYLTADEDASSCESGARWPGTDAPLQNCHLGTHRKTQALIDFGKIVVTQTRAFRNLSNDFFVARNLYARVVMDPSSENRFAQALGPFLDNYDYVALMAMPYLDETAAQPKAWLRALEAKVAAHPLGLRKTVFELQAKNWKTDRWIDSSTLEGWMQELIGLGATNLAYYPDDFLNNRPAFNPTFSGISLESFPHGSFPEQKDVR